MKYSQREKKREVNIYMKEKKHSLNVFSTIYANVNVIDELENIAGEEKKKKEEKKRIQSILR